MPSWKKVIVSGSDASLNSINVATNVVAQSFTGSLFGTASFAVSSSQANSSSFATTASYALNAEESVFTAIVTNNGSSNYVIDGVIKPILTFVPGASYRFDTSGVVGSHPFRFSLSPNGPTQYTYGVTIGANFTQIDIDYSTSQSLYYYCTNHSGMGNEANVLRSENLVSTTTFNAFSSSINSFTSSTNTSISALNITTASLNATTASLNSFSASINSFTASQNALNSTFATTGSNIFIGNQTITGSFNLTGSQTITGNLTVTDTITAQTLVVQTITSSVDFVTGSTHFGTLISNTHQFTGSVSISGSLTVNGSSAILTDQTSSMSVATASFVETAQTASFVQIAQTASFVQTAQTASFVQNAQTASFVQTSSFAQTAATASFFSGSVSNAISASYAETASFAQTAATASFFSGSISNAVSASFATTASFAQNAATASFFSGSISNAISASYAETASFAITASFAQTAATASFFSGSISNAISASYAVTASFSNTSTSASFATNAITASYALFAANGGGGGGGGATVTHTQLTASTTWSFNHNLNSQTPLLQVYNLSYNQIIPNEIVSIDAFTSEIRFDYTQAGYAVASTGGITVTGSTPRLTQTVAATTWSFAHNLGTQFPGFEVFDQNDYVIVPAGIYAIDENNAEIYFATPSTGVAIANFSGIGGVGFTATSASYATTASYAFFAATASYASNITISGSINDVDYIDFDTNVGYTLAEGRLGWDSGEGTLQLGLEGGNVQYALGEQIYQYVYNAETSSLSKGQVVFISGSQGNRIAVKLADNSGDPTSAGTLGLVAEAITAGANGWVITEGPLRKLNTIGLTAGSLLYLGETPGTYTETKPIAPRHEVRVGYVERVHATVGSIYVKVDNGYEIGELHDVVDNTTTASYGDLLVKSGSVWHDSRQLTGSYGLTGSLQATSFTGSLLGTASFATYAATASYSDQFYIGQTQTQYATVTSSINGSNIVFNVATGSYSSAFFKYTVASGSNARSGEIMSVWNGSTVTFTDNSTTDIGTTTAVTSSVAISASNAQLTMQTNTAGWRIKSIATFM